jgi:hypothetical protein
MPSNLGASKHRRLQMEAQRTMRSRFFASGAAALIVAAVTGCASGSVPGTAAVSTGSPRSQAAGHRLTASPSADSPAAAPAGQASRPAACRTHDLGTRFQAGGYGTGDDFGSIEIWNPGTAQCRLAGAVNFTAFFADGTIDLNARPNRPLPPLALTLPAHMIRPREGADLSGYLVATLMGPERDDPAQPDGSCRPRDELTPATLMLSIGRVTLRIRNQDPASPAIRGMNRAVYGCHGRVFLENLTGPAAR